MSKVLAELRDGLARYRTLTRAIGLVLGTCLLTAVLWWVPRYQVAHTPGVTGEKRFESEDEARKTLAQILGGAVVLLGLYFSAKTFGLSREGQLTDRYTKAIEQLGKSDGGQPNIEVRLGAIYALERIAIDSPRDHWTIMEVLTAYVRRNAPLEPGREYEPKEKPRTEIQAILTVLGRRHVDEEREKPDHVLDLSRSRLWNADFCWGNYEKARFSFADLRGADLYSARLERATLRNGDYQKASFRNADLHRASCFMGDFQEAKFLGNNCRETDFESCKFQGADLSKVELTGAKIANARFYRVTGLVEDQVKNALGWEKARYSPELRRQLKLQDTAEDTSEHSLYGDLQGSS